MSHVNIEEIVDDVKALSPADQLYLRDLIDTWLQEAPSQTEDEFEALLVGEGLLHSVDRDLVQAQYDAFEPVVTTGKPLSEVILEERR